MTKTMRQRGCNWTQQEKDIFIKIMRQSASVFENKQNDTNSIKQKTNEWLKVQKKLEKHCGNKRDIRQMKGFWKRLKMKARANMLTLNMSVDEDQPESPSSCLTDLITEHTEYDSDELVKTVITPKKHTIQLQDEISEQDSKSPNYDKEMHNNLENRINPSCIECVLNDDEVEAEPNLITVDENKEHQSELNHKTAIEDSNVNNIKRTKELLEEEYALRAYYTILNIGSDI